MVDEAWVFGGCHGVILATDTSTVSEYVLSIPRDDYRVADPDEGWLDLDDIWLDTEPYDVHLGPCVNMKMQRSLRAFDALDIEGLCGFLDSEDVSLKVRHFLFFFAPSSHHLMSPSCSARRSQH